MSAVQGFVVTASGRSLFAKLTATAKPLNFTRVMFGTGKMPEGADLFAMTGLVEPFAEGVSTTPVYKNDTVSMVLEFRSDLNGGLEKTIWLNEFGLFASDPDGEEVLVCYGNLGDCPDSVLAFRDGANTVRDYPITLIIGAVPDVNISAPAGAYLTSEDAEALINACLRRAVGMNAVSFTIPENAWTETAHGRFGYCAEIAMGGVSETQHPIATLDSAGIEIAGQCGFGSVVETLDGKLRFWSEIKPTVAISGTCLLFTEGAGGGSGIGGTLPVATATTLGGVKVGDGLNITGDGILSINSTGIIDEVAASDEDVNEMIKAVFDSESGN